MAALWATHFGGLNPPELFPIFGSGAAGLCLSGISLQNDVLARSEEQKLGLGASGCPEAQNCLFISIAGNIAGKCRQTGLGTIHSLDFIAVGCGPSQPLLHSWAQTGDQAWHLQNCRKNLQICRVPKEDSRSQCTCRVFRKLLRSTTWRNQTGLPDIKTVGTVAKGLTGATWAPEWSADSWGASWKIVCRLGKKIL